MTEDDVVIIQCVINLVTNLAIFSVGLVESTSEILVMFQFSLNLGTARLLLLLSLLWRRDVLLWVEE